MRTHLVAVAGAVTKPAPLTTDQHRLVIENIAFALYMAKRLECIVPIADRVSLAKIGLCEAAQRFDPTRGVGFATYSAFWIRARIYEQAEKMMTARANEVPFTTAMTGDGKKVDADKIMPRHMQVEAGHDRSVDALDDSRSVAAAMRELTPLEQEIIRRRYLAIEPETLKQIGESHGFTREWVRLLEMRALRKLKIYMAGKI